MKIITVLKRLSPKVQTVKKGPNDKRYVQKKGCICNVQFKKESRFGQLLEYVVKLATYFRFFNLH